ncbi:hypothetical protein PQG65_10045 [Corynebacterium pseudodiphtheriticum]|uniref:hypothetical protein n=1 Tax=Corynebacterium pseudodiphtheriticum TaxID=37637 RepID=UPI00234CD5AC|nr:hypothetical protein [Corynebacterium pseudodiphtheriticum]MDC7111698.1 hypothetical protein [Corynebacterium pseudodiphtheriticum]MDC7115628.1 hypothetical protein [Corynebacterium pseudodiphtheriticum]
MITPVPTPLPVEVTNWPASSPQSPTLVLSGASFVVALAALVVAIATLRFTKQAWEKEGAVLVVDPTFEYWGSKSVFNRDHAEFKLSIENVGRTRTEIRSVSVATITSDGFESSIWSRSGEELLKEQKQLDAGQIVEALPDPMKFPNFISKDSAADIIDAVVVVHDTHGVERANFSEHGVDELRQFISRNGK